jgi:hypothetical protein
MPLQVTQKYVISGEGSPPFNKDWVNYEDYRNALIKISEHDTLFLQEIAKNVPAEKLKPHFDSKNSIAIGYGLDLLVRKDNAEINEYLAVAGVAKLSGDDEKTIDAARTLRNEFVKFNLTPKDPANDTGLTERIRKANEYLDKLKDTLNANQTVVTFPTGASAQAKLEILMEYYVDKLTLKLGEIEDANQLLSYFIKKELDGKITLPDSKERAAILSVLYQVPKSPTLIGLANGTITDSDKDTRAKIWAEIRYLGTPNGFQGRRDRESNAFGLFNGNDGTFAGDTAEALSTIDYLLRGERIGADGVRTILFEHIDGLAGDYQVAHLRASIAPALAHLADTYAEGAALEAAYLLRDGETDLNAADIKSSGVNLIRGNELVNNIQGGAKQDYIYGLAGIDTIRGNDGDDRIYGGADGDFLYGGNNSDVLYGEDGEDELHGDDGVDFLYGGAMRDSLLGGAGIDYLEGGQGKDFL